MYLAGISTAIALARQIMEIMEVHAQNKGSLLKESVRLVEDIQNLESLRISRVQNGFAKLDDDIASLQSGLSELLRYCEKVFRKRTGFGGLVRHFRTNVVGAIAIQKKIMEIRKEADRAYLQFLVFNSVNNSVSIETVVGRGAETLELVSMLQKSLGDRIVAARDNRTCKQAPLRADSMAAIEKKQVWHRTALKLDDAQEEKRAELTILCIKVRAFGSYSSKDTGAAFFRDGISPDGYVFPGSETHFPGFANPEATRADAVQETYALLSALKSGNSNMSAIAWLDRVTSLSVTLGSSLGLKAEALQLSQICCAIARHLNKYCPYLFKGDLSLSLHNLSIHLCNVGQYQDALAAAQESIGLEQWLFEQNSNKYKPILACSLSNLSNCFSLVGKHKEALVTVQEALQYYRQLADGDNEGFGSDLACSLNNVGNCLFVAGQHQEALEAMQEAVKLCRQLNKKKPEVYGPDLATFLNNLSNHLSHAEKNKESLEAIKEAVQLYRQLTERTPEVFESDLAMSLNNLSNHLSLSKNHKGALEAIKEAVSLYRQLAEKFPDVFECDLATSLNNYSGHLSACGEGCDAIDAVQEAVSLFRHLVLQNPETYEINLGNALETYGSMLKKYGHTRDAAIHLRESVSILEKYLDVCPGLVKEPYDCALNSLNELSAMQCLAVAAPNYASKHTHLY